MNGTEGKRRTFPKTGSVVPDEHLPCTCGVTRRTAETLRVHKWLAHGEQQT
jgi:hypothetical protein